MNDAQILQQQATKTPTPRSPPPPPPRQIVYVQRTDLRNRVWAGFLYDVGIWCGSVVGIALLVIVGTIITTVLGIGLAGIAGGM